MSNKVFKFRKTIFENPNIRTIARTKESAFQSMLLTLEIINSKNVIDIRQFLSSVERIIIGNIRRKLVKNNNLKVNVVVLLEYKKNEQYQQKNFKTHNEIITQAINFNEFYTAVIQKILNEMEEYEIRGSQWMLRRNS